MTVGKFIEIAKGRTDKGAVMMIDGEIWGGVLRLADKQTWVLTDGRTTFIFGEPDEDAHDLPERVRFFIEVI